MSEVPKEALDEWARDVIKWTRDVLENGDPRITMQKAEDIVMAIIVATREEYRKDVLELIKAIIKVIREG